MRLVLVLLFIGAVVYAAMLGLATWVRPVMTHMTIDIPASRVQPRLLPAMEKVNLPGPGMAAAERALL